MNQRRRSRKARPGWQNGEEGRREDETAAAPSGSNRLTPAHWVAILWCVGWFVLFNTQPIANNGINRLDLWKSLPFAYLDLVDPPARQNAPPSGIAYLPERLWDTALAAFLVLGSTGWGIALLGGLLSPSSRQDQEIQEFADGPASISPAGLAGVLFVGGTLGLALTATVILGLGTTGLPSPLLLSLWLAAGGTIGLLTAKKATGSLRTLLFPVEEITRHLHTAYCERNWRPFLVLTMLAVFLWTTWLAALTPTIEFDSKEYHLGGPKEYYLHGRVGFLPDNVYTSFPFLCEMLTLGGMILRGGWEAGAQVAGVTLMTYHLLTACGLYAAATLLSREADARSSSTGAWAAILWLTTPWIYRVSSMPLVEGPFAAYLLGAVLAILVLDQRFHRNTHGAIPFPQWSNLGIAAIAGLFAGGAFGCKYPAAPFVAVPCFGWILYRSLTAPAVLLPQAPGTVRGPSRIVATLQLASAFIVGWLVFGSPWLLKNVLETGNPFYPLLYTLFGGTDWSAALNEKWRRAHQPPNYHLLNIVRDFRGILMGSDWQSCLIGMSLPLGLRAWRGQGRSWLFIYSLYFYAAWWLLTHRIDRFWVPILPVFCLLGGCGLAWLAASHRYARTLLIVLAGLCCFFNYGVNSSGLGNYNSWLMSLPAARLQSARITNPDLLILNDAYESGKIPADSRILMVGEARIFDAKFPYRYNTVFDISLFEAWLGAGDPAIPEADRSFKPVEEIRKTLQEQGITHIYVNWLEILRYRTSYGYTDFVTEKRFLDLQQMGILGDELPWPDGYGFELAEKMADNERAMVNRWSPELIRKAWIDGKMKEVFVTGQWFAVQPGH